MAKFSLTEPFHIKNDNSDRPMYFGGMILNKDLSSAYQYEYWLKSVLEHRRDKYIGNRKIKSKPKRGVSFFYGMLAIYEKKKRKGAYKKGDYHYVPLDDPLVCIDEEATNYKMLSLKGRKLKIIEFEVYKYIRRKGHMPTWYDDFN